MAGRGKLLSSKCSRQLLPSLLCTQRADLGQCPEIRKEHYFKNVHERALCGSLILLPVVHKSDQLRNRSCSKKIQSTRVRSQPINVGAVWIQFMFCFLFQLLEGRMGLKENIRNDDPRKGHARGETIKNQRVKSLICDMKNTNL